MYSIDPADNEDALKINICEDSSGAAPALNIHALDLANNFEVLQRGNQP